MAEYVTCKFGELEPFKWHRTKWGDPRYVTATGLEFRGTPIILLVNQYVGATIEGEYKIEVELASSLAVVLIRDIKPEEKQYVRRAIKYNKVKIARSIFNFVFPRTSW